MDWISVASIKSDPHAQRRGLRSFGLVMTAALGATGTLLAWRGRAGAPYALTAAALFLTFGIIQPLWLAPIERIWMKFAEVLGAVMTRAILTVAFFVVITPLGLLRRLLSSDPLSLRSDPSVETYWVPVEKDGPGSRPDRPY